MADYYLDLQEMLNKANYDSASRQMQFQDYMSSTAHQREVKDLIAAGLNPVLSANNGAAALPGAYATIDNSATSAKMAERQLGMQLKAQELMNKYSTDVGYRLGIQQAGIAAAATTAVGAMNAAASRYGADQAYAASTYSSDTSLKNSREQRAYDNTHPSNAYQAGGSVLSMLGDYFNNRGNVSSYAPGNGSAK